MNSWGSEAGPESRAGDGQAGPGACGSPVADVADVAATRGGVGGAAGGGLVLDRYLQIYNTLIKNFFDHAFDC